MMGNRIVIERTEEFLNSLLGKFAFVYYPNNQGHFLSVEKYDLSRGSIGSIKPEIKTLIQRFPDKKDELLSDPDSYIYHYLDDLESIELWGNSVDTTYARK